MQHGSGLLLHPRNMGAGDDGQGDTAERHRLVQQSLQIPYEIPALCKYGPACLRRKVLTLVISIDLGRLNPAGPAPDQLV
ncbi:hypothetical protein D3C80_2099820 [compost metagenome]